MKLNKKLWNTFAFVCLLLLIGGVAQNEWKLNAISVSCPEDEAVGCLNVFYNSSDAICESRPELCFVEVISPGETIGDKPGFLYKNYGAFVLTLLCLTSMIEYRLQTRKNGNSNKK